MDTFRKGGHAQTTCVAFCMATEVIDPLSCRIAGDRGSSSSCPALSTAIEGRGQRRLVRPRGEILRGHLRSPRRRITRRNDGNADWRSSAWAAIRFLESAEAASPPASTRYVTVFNARIQPRGHHGSHPQGASHCYSRCWDSARSHVMQTSRSGVAPASISGQCAGGIPVRMGVRSGVPRHLPPGRDSGWATW